MNRKELVVSALENGTVLDHIPAENVYKALDILNLKGIENQITIGINLTSRIYGQKPLSPLIHHSQLHIHSYLRNLRMRYQWWHACRMP